MGKRTQHRPQTGEMDLFSSAPEPQLRLRLGHMSWPDSGLLPVNHAGSRVRDSVWADLAQSRAPLVVAGFASIAQIVELAAEISCSSRPATLRVLLGTEPFATERLAFGSPSSTFTEEVRAYWRERGISLALSAKVIQAIEALDAGTFQVRFVPGRTRLHAKIYAGDRAGTVGSSNFTANGLSEQFEANVRCEKGRDPAGYARARQAAENYWHIGQDWSVELRTLLEGLLAFVSWREALARACADLLEGQWAQDYLGSTAGASRLWPSQIAGVAQALWVVENVGSVLVADATGSGKTRMGAHLTRAVRDRLWSTGRVRSDLTVLVCPPAVVDQWSREAISCGLTLSAISQGLLSRKHAAGPRAEEGAVANAQILAIDEAHNFLAHGSNRSGHVRGSGADHVLMFTATPINRSARDLLTLVDQLGADNFEDETLAVLDRLYRRQDHWQLSETDREVLRREIQQFTVRRTKTMLNALVDRSPADYRHPETGRVCRYPAHDTRSYATGEDDHDRAVAEMIREAASGLLGITALGPVLKVPAWQRTEISEEQWLEGRLRGAIGLVAYQVRAAMRSSQAALLEHVVGTAEASKRLSIIGLTKPTPSGNLLGKIAIAREAGPPRIELNCTVPDWLTDTARWHEACDQQLDVYRQIELLAMKLGDRRERAKAAVVAELATRHPRVLAFDHLPITLARIENLMRGIGVPVLVATGGATRERKKVRERFARTATEPGIALCSDAMNEGINLQGASAVVQFDMPTTLRVAEQRVGRVDRMDSPHDRIEVWWPADSESFATRADDLLTARNEESAALLGSNLRIPADPYAVIRPETFTTVPEEEKVTWDGLRDALEPVRGLVTGDRPLVDARTYASYRDATEHVLARVSPVRSDSAWAFFAVRSATSGAPRWLLLEETVAGSVVGLEQVTARLRDLLAEDPPSAGVDDRCVETLERFLRRAKEAEVGLLPRRHQRALVQMHRVCREWAEAARRTGAAEVGERWEAVAAVSRVDVDATGADLHQVADLWLSLVKPLRLAARADRRRAYSRLADIDPMLRSTPLALADVEAAMSKVAIAQPLEQRISACILGVRS